MVIEFRCPNGHRLNCPDERAGLPGKCPKCKAAFRVPQPQAAETAGAERPESPISDSGVSEPELNLPPAETDNLAFLGGGDSENGAHEESDFGSILGSSLGSGKVANPAEMAGETESTAGESSGAESPSAGSSGAGSSGAESSGTASSAAATPSTAPAPAAEERIVFLCPKGHKLNCPASMQGRPGKCPHCGATFLVPRYEPGDDVEDEEDEGDDDDDNEDDESDESSADDESPREPSAEEQLIEQAIDGFNGDAFQGDPFAFDFSSLTTETVGTVGMAGVFQRLWLHKRTGGIVELYLKGGEVIAPEWFSPRQSQETHGMFAFAERDGSLTLTAISWDAIERIAVRGIAELPPGMFDEEA